MTNGQLGVLRGYLANADKVRSQGFEFDFSVRPNERFTAYVNGAYTDATYRKFVDAPCPPELSGGTTVAGRPDAQRARHPRRPEPGQLRHLRPAPAGRLEVDASRSAPRRTTRSTLLGNEGEVYLGYDGSYSLELLVQRLAVGLHLGGRLLAVELPGRLPDA